MAEVYWIHLPEHTDMFSQGYIGYTSKTAQERFKEHKFYAHRPTNKEYKYIGCTHLYAAINKYGVDNVVVDTLVISDDRYCLDLEYKLRSFPNVGWNIAVGGSKPCLGVTQRPEVIAKRVKSLKQVWANNPAAKDRHRAMLKKRHQDNPELREISRATSNRLWADPLHRQRQSEIQKEKYKDPAYNAMMHAYVIPGSISAGMVPWGNGTSDINRWLLAEYYYESWINNNRGGTKLLARVHNISNKSYFASLIKKFKEGWIPSQDDKYQEWKRQQEKDSNNDS